MDGWLDGWMDGWNYCLFSSLRYANKSWPYSSLCHSSCLLCGQWKGMVKQKVLPPSHWVSRKADLKQLCFWHLYAEYLARESGTLSLLKKFKVAPLAKESKTDDLRQHAEISASIPCLWISFLLGLHSSYDLACHDKTWAPLCQAAIIAVLRTGHPFSISLPLILSWMHSDTALVII